MTRTSADAVSDLALREWGPAAVVLSAAGPTSGPRVALEPDAAATAAAMLQWASREGISLVPSGSGTRLGAAARRADAVLSTRRLITGTDHRAGDLTATLPAGATLDAANTLLGRERQWLALDPADGVHATIGGIVAANDSGPRQHRHGTPRDLIIGVEIALTNGRLAHAGGQVVKNVAGYDLARLMCGSFGSLALITRATFKLSPLPAASRTIVAALPGARQTADLGLAIAASPLTPSAVDIEGPPYSLLVRFETTVRAAEQQTAAALDICRRLGADVTVLDRDAEQARWRASEARVWSTCATVLKLSVLPTSTADVVEDAARLAEAHRIEHTVAGRAAIGALFVGLTGPADAHPPIIEALRRQIVEARGFLTVVRAQEQVDSRVDRWGDLGGALRVLRAVKTRFDPANILHPGGGPGNT
jgi:glycolate oxidase FAD binding subunit